MHFFVLILHANTNANGAANKLLFILVKNRLSTQSCAKKHIFLRQISSVNMVYLLNFEF